MQTGEKQHYEAERIKFILAYNQEAERINYLVKTYPDNARYQKADENITQMLDVFEFMGQYVQSLHTHITLLKLQSELLSQDYMKSIDASLDQFLILAAKK